MQLTLLRKWKTDNSIVGKLTSDKDFSGFSLELPWRNNHMNESCIPAGTYEIKLTYSPHFHMDIPLLQDVPGRTDIKMHVANFPHDIHGCIGVGYSKNVDFVGGSVKAVGDLIAEMQKAKAVEEEISISIREE